MPPVEELTEPEGDGDVLTPPEADGELTLPVAGELTVLPDGELVLTPVPLEAPVRGAPDTAGPPLTEPDVEPLLTDPEAPVLDVVGEADGLPEMPAACIACWLQRSKSARVMVPCAMAATGSRTAPMATADPMVLAILDMSDLLEGFEGPKRFKFTAIGRGGDEGTICSVVILSGAHPPARKEPP